MKNTLSILENIKKKITKLDKPVEEEKKSFADLDDEFEYVDDADDEEMVNIHEDENQERSDHDVMLEHEIENSFPDIDSSELEEGTSQSSGESSEANDDSFVVNSFEQDDNHEESQKEVSSFMSEDNDSDFNLENIDQEVGDVVLENQEDEKIESQNSEITSELPDIVDSNQDLEEGMEEINLNQEVENSIDSDNIEDISQENISQNIENADSVSENGEEDIFGSDSNVEPVSEDDQTDNNVGGEFEMNVSGSIEEKNAENIGSQDGEEDIFAAELDNMNQEENKIDEIVDNSQNEPELGGESDIKKEVFEEEYENFKAETQNIEKDEKNSDDELFGELDQEGSVFDKADDNQDNIPEVESVVDPVEQNIPSDDNRQQKNYMDSINLEELDMKISSDSGVDSQINEPENHDLADSVEEKNVALEENIDDLMKENDDLGRMLEEKDSQHFEQLKAIDEIKQEKQLKAEEEKVLGEEPLAVSDSDIESEDDKIEDELFSKEDNLLSESEVDLDLELESPFEEEKSYEIVKDDEVDDLSGEKVEEIDSQDLDDHIINSGLAEKVSDSINNLVEAKKMVKKVDNFAKSDLLTEVATELMKPKLEKWFNENLPNLVEKVVREEIKAIITKENSEE